MSQNSEFLPIQKTHWKQFLDHISKLAKGSWVQLEIAGSQLGDQVEKGWTHLNGFSYDQSSGIVYLHTDDLEHAIPSPQEVLALLNGGTKAIVVKDLEGSIQTIRFRELVPLPGTS